MDCCTLSCTGYTDAIQSLIYQDANKNTIIITSNEIQFKVNQLDILCKIDSNGLSVYNSQGLLIGWWNVTEKLRTLLDDSIIIKNDISGINTTIGTIQTEISTLQGEITLHDGRLVLLETVLSGVTAVQLATLFSDVVTLLGAMVNKVDKSNFGSGDVGIFESVGGYFINIVYNEDHFIDEVVLGTNNRVFTLKEPYKSLPTTLQNKTNFNNLVVSNASSILSTLTISGNTLINNSSTFTNNLNISGNVIINNSSTFTNSLSISGNTLFNNSSTFINNLNISGSTLFNNSSTFINNLNISGSTLFNNTATFLNSLNISGNAIINGSISFLGNLNISGPMIFTNASTFTNNLNISGNVIINNASTISNNLNVSGNVIINNASTFTNNLNIVGSAIINNSLTLNNTINISGNATFNNSLLVTGTSFFNNDVTVFSSLNISGKSFFGNTPRNAKGVFEVEDNFYVLKDMVLDQRPGGNDVIGDRIIFRTDDSTYYRFDDFTGMMLYCISKTTSLYNQYGTIAMTADTININGNLSLQGRIISPSIGNKTPLYFIANTIVIISGTPFVAYDIDLNFYTKSFTLDSKRVRHFRLRTWTSDCDFESTNDTAKLYQIFMSDVGGLKIRNYSSDFDDNTRLQSLYFKQPSLMRKTFDLLTYLIPTSLYGISVKVYFIFEDLL